MPDTRPLTLMGDANVPDMPLTDAQVNHLRRLLAWMRCEWMLDPDMQRGMLSAVESLGAMGAITPEQATAYVAERAEKINRCPVYVRQAVKMLTQALRQHEQLSGVVEELNQQDRRSGKKVQVLLVEQKTAGGPGMGGHHG